MATGDIVRYRDVRDIVRDLPNRADKPTVYDAITVPEQDRTLWKAAVGGVIALGVLLVFVVHRAFFGPPGSVASSIPTLLFFGVPMAALFVYVVKAPRRIPAHDEPVPHWARVPEFGEPGRGLNAATFGAENTEAGRVGELSTAEVLRLTIGFDFPAARIFHGLRWPGSERADMDHAILLGHRLLLVDSKLYRKATYQWDETTSWLSRDGQPFTELRFGHALTATRNVLTQHRFTGITDVAALVLIHDPSGDPRRPSVISTGTSPDPRRAPIRVCNVADGIRFAQHWLSHGNLNVDEVSVRAVREMARMLY